MSLVHLVLEAIAHQKSLDYEKSIAKKLYDNGRGVNSDGAGHNSKRADATIIADDGSHHSLEIKKSHSARMTQLSIAHTKEKGWHIPVISRLSKPAYAKHVEKSGILQKLNDTWGDPTGKEKPKDLYHDDVNGAEGVGAHYGKDKKTPYIHIGGGHGFFKTTDDDPAKIGAPKISGDGWRLRARVKSLGRTKADGTADKMFIINSTISKKGLGRSHLSLDADPT